MLQARTLVTLPRHGGPAECGGPWISHGAQKDSADPQRTTRGTRRLYEPAGGTAVAVASWSRTGIPIDDRKPRPCSPGDSRATASRGASRRPTRAEQIPPAVVGRSRGCGARRIH